MPKELHNTIAKFVLTLYAAISVIFPLAHKDGFAPESHPVFSNTDETASAFHAVDSDIICPAHQFAESTTGTPVSSFTIFSPARVSFLIVLRQPECIVAPLRNLSSRAPPLA